MVFCGPHEGRHTGVLVAKKLDEVIDSLLLPEICHKAMTTDNAANMKVACRESRTIDLGTTCFAHTLNLVVVNAIKSVPKIQIAVDEFKKLVGGCHKSTLYCERIRKECEDLNRSGTTPTTYNKMIQPVDTRWNSMLMMIRSVVKLREALEGIRDGGRANDANLIELIPTQESFDLLDSIIQVLTRFEEVSTFMSSEKIPIYRLLPRWRWEGRVNSSKISELILNTAKT